MKSERLSLLLLLCSWTEQSEEYFLGLSICLQTSTLPVNFEIHVWKTQYFYLLYIFLVSSTHRRRKCWCWLRPWSWACPNKLPSWRGGVSQTHLVLWVSSAIKLRKLYKTKHFYQKKYHTIFLQALLVTVQIWLEFCELQETCCLWPLEAIFSPHQTCLLWANPSLTSHDWMGKNVYQ